MSTATDSRGRPRGADRLEEHHRELDARFEQLVSRARDGAPAELRAEWTAFERALLRHLELEEAELLPAFARHDAAEARAILAEHAEIRAALLDMGLNLDLHLLRAEAIEAFVQRLRAHARREDASLYAWAERRVPPAGWRSIEEGLEEAAHHRPEDRPRGLFRGLIM